MTINKLMTVTIVADSFGRPPQMRGEPIVRRVQGDGQDHAPREHWNERPNQDERPIEQEGQQGEPDRQLYDLITRSGLPKNSR
jgi:hypothetical protein